MLRSPAQRLLALTMVLAFLAGTGRSALGLHDCLHHLGHGSHSSPSALVDAGSSGNSPGAHAGHAGHGHDSPRGDVAHSLPGEDGEGPLPGPCTCFGSCACACAPSGPAAGALVAVHSPPAPLPFLEEDVDLVDPRQVRWDRPPATAPPSTLRVTAST